LVGHSSFRHSRGFTLLELIVVMLLMCIAAAIAVPSMRGFGQNQRMRGCTSQLVALGSWARAQSITLGLPHRLNIDPATGTYWVTVQRAGVYETVGQDFGRTFTAPEGVTLRWYGPAATDGSMVPYLEFLPTGRASAAASVLVVEPDGVGSTEVACLSPAEPFRVLADFERTVR
jgi:prepilin-type N-terminal cleavage/methylation domain-containing protein